MTASAPTAQRLLDREELLPAAVVEPPFVVVARPAVEAHDQGGRAGGEVAELLGVAVGAHDAVGAAGEHALHRLARPLHPRQTAPIAGVVHGDDQRLAVGPDDLAHTRFHVGCLRAAARRDVVRSAYPSRAPPVRSWSFCVDSSQSHVDGIGEVEHAPGGHVVDDEDVDESQPERAEDGVRFVGAGGDRDHVVQRRQVGEAHPDHPVADREVADTPLGVEEADQDVAHGAGRADRFERGRVDVAGAQHAGVTRFRHADPDQPDLGPAPDRQRLPDLRVLDERLAYALGLDDHRGGQVVRASRAAARRPCG